MDIGLSGKKTTMYQYQSAGEASGAQVTLIAYAMLNTYIIRITLFTP